MFGRVGVSLEENIFFRGGIVGFIPGETFLKRGKNKEFTVFVVKKGITC